MHPRAALAPRPLSRRSMRGGPRKKRAPAPPARAVKGSRHHDSGVSAYRIRLEGIRFRGRHGASKEERRLPQDFCVTLEVDLPVTALPRDDVRAQVFDYDVLANIVVDEGTGASYQLLETLAQRLIARLLSETRAIRVNISIRKFGPPTSASVDSASVELVGVQPSKK